jgi:ParB family chromosome partitioning protein
VAKKQNDYLASLLAGGADAENSGHADSPSTPSPAASRDHVPAPSPGERTIARAGLSLLGRENALARVASGEVRQVTQLLLDPARVRIWSGNARLQAQLKEENCRDLIDSILAEGGQKVAAVVRHLHGDATYDYELIAGTRRHFAISWLRANNYPDMKLLAHVAELDDESAFRLADIENRARKDISDIERARNYADAIERHYGGKAVRMAERLNLSKGWLSKMLKAATLPDLNPAYKLALALDDKNRAKAILREAELISAANHKAASRGLPALAGGSVITRLMNANSQASPLSSNLRMEVKGALGRPIISVKTVNRQGVTLHLPMASGASDEELTDALCHILTSLRENGVVVK